MANELTEEKRLKLIEETRQAAFALADDLAFIRKLLAQNDLSPGDIRRMSAQLRRFLVDGDLRRVAAPRVGRLYIKAPQLKPLHHANERSPITIAFGGFLDFPSMKLAHMVVSQQRIDGFEDPEETVDLLIDQFCAQRVICLQGKWVTRQEVVKYIANTASGVHSDAAKEPSHKLLEELTGYAGLRLSNGGATLEMNIEAIKDAPQPWQFDRERVSLALAQVMSTAQYLERSPTVLALEKVIASE